MLIAAIVIASVALVVSLIALAVAFGSLGISRSTKSYAEHTSRAVRRITNR